MKSIQEISAHRNDGWRGQYNRIRRWIDKFKNLSIAENKSSAKTHEYYDTMYTCFQNIFFLKDWLMNEASIEFQHIPTLKDDLNTFINSNVVMGICRDICNGTKHYDINNPSIDSEFGFIRQYNPISKIQDNAEWEIIICAGGQVYNPLELIEECVSLWDKFIETKLNLFKSLNA